MTTIVGGGRIATMKTGAKVQSELDESMFRVLFDRNPIGVAVENLEGRPLLANPALCSMLGMTEDELRSKHCVDFSPPEDAKKDWAFFEQLRAGSIDHYQLEKHYLRRDGSQFWGRLTVSLVARRRSQFVIATVEQLAAPMVAELQKLRSEAQVNSAAALIIQEHETQSRAMAREFHNWIDRLILISLGLDATQSERHGAREEIESLTRDIHSLSERVYPTKLEYLGLVSAVAALCRDFGAREGWAIDFKASSVPDEMSEQVRLCAYRVVESTLEAICSGTPQRLQVSMNAVSNVLNIIVSGLGNAMNPAGSLVESTSRTATIAEWVNLVRGQVDIYPAAEAGVLVRARIPLD
jgi:PAS domain S-box-containing protein